MSFRKSPSVISNENVAERERDLINNENENRDNRTKRNTRNNNNMNNYPNIVNNDDNDDNNGSGTKVAYPKVLSPEKIAALEKQKKANNKKQNNVEKLAAMEKRRQAELNEENKARQKKMNNNAAEERQKKERNKMRNLAKKNDRSPSMNITNLSEKTAHQRKKALKSSKKEAKMGNVLTNIDKDLANIASKLAKNRKLITVKNQEKLDKISNYLRLKNSNIKNMKQKEQKSIKVRANEMKSLVKTIKTEVDEIMEEKFIDGMRNRIKSLNNSITNNKDADQESKELWKRLQELNLTAASKEDVEDWFGVSSNKLDQKIKDYGIKLPKQSKQLRTMEKMLANTDFVMFPKELLNTLKDMKVKNNKNENERVIESPLLVK